MTDVIEAAAMRCRTLADGSLRIECEIEPRNAQAAFALFGSPGTPMALAALKVGTAAEAKSDEVAPAEEAKRDKPAGGLLSQWLAMRCNEYEFQRWLREVAWPVQWQKSLDKSARSVAPTIRPDLVAAECVRVVCEVKSRAEVDTDPEAAKRCNERIRHPWQKHHLARTA
jgi:hypothetical protein